MKVFKMLKIYIFLKNFVINQNCVGIIFLRILKNKYINRIQLLFDEFYSEKNKIK